VLVVPLLSIILFQKRRLFGSYYIALLRRTEGGL
jgi:hypothetical protein